MHSKPKPLFTLLAFFVNVTQMMQTSFVIRNVRRLMDQKLPTSFCVKLINQISKTCGGEKSAGGKITMVVEQSLTLRGSALRSQEYIRVMLAV